MENLIIYSLRSNRKLAKKLADKYHATLGEISFDHFKDGEILVKTLTDVRNKDVIIVESTARKAHERLFELLLLIDSIKRSGANSVKLYIPYFGYSRQERVSWINEPVSCEVVGFLYVFWKAILCKMYDLQIFSPIPWIFFHSVDRGLCFTKVIKFGETHFIYFFLL